MFAVLSVTKVEKSTDSARIITFQIPKHLQTQFSYIPGQYVTIHRIGDPSIKRCYSICSKANSENLQIGVKRVTGGNMSTYIVDELKEGDELSVSFPEGNFQLHSSLTPSSYVFIAGGSGITPIRSMMDHVITFEPKSKILLLYGNKDEQNIIFRRYFEEINKNKNVQVIHSLDKPNSDWNGEVGMLSYEKLNELIRKNLRRAKNSKYYICGPTKMMENAQKAIGGFDVPSSNIFLEYFTIESTTETAQNQDTRFVEVKTDFGRYDIKVNPKESILDAALRTGIDLPYSCKNGICSSCKQKRQSGNVQMTQDAGLTEKEKSAGYVLLCQSYPLDSDVIIDCTESAGTSKGNKRNYRKIALVSGFLLALILLGAFVIPEKKSFLAIGHMNTGHENLACNDCHSPSKGNIFQQLNANAKFLLGARSSAVSFGTNDVENSKCLSCHNRPNDRHPVHRFNEPRFAEARKNLGPENCESCHSEHKEQRIALENLTYCVDCHSDTELSEDPLDVSHAELIATSNWKTCIQCHDFHGNHVMVTPHRMKDTIPFSSIVAYAKGGKDPYSSKKEYIATEQAEEIKKMMSK